MEQSRDWNSEETKIPEDSQKLDITAGAASGERVSSPSPEDGEVPGGMSPRNPASTKKPRNELMEWIKAIVIAVILVWLIRWLLITPFIVDGESMEPNFLNGERIIVNKVLYDFREPKRGEVIVFHVPDEQRDFIKRVIALPGDTVKVQGDTVYVNGKAIDEPYLKEAIAKAHAQGQEYNNLDFPNADFPNGTVPAGTLFVMGDHRDNSKDSRMIGYIPMSRVVGRAELIFWPLKDIEYIGKGF